MPSSNKYVVIHKETKRAIRVRSGAIVVRRDGLFFSLTINGQQVAHSHDINQALVPMKNRQRADSIKAIMALDCVTENDTDILFRGWPVTWAKS